MLLLRQIRRVKFYFRYYSSTESTNSNSKTTHFGFETVDENEKSKKVHDVFENVASRYDLMNDVMSFGIHRFWKDQFVNRLNPTANIRLLDVAGGTGDIAFRVHRRISDQSSGIVTSQARSIELGTDPLSPSAASSSSNDAQSIGSIDSDQNIRPITVCDINQAMLDVGKRRAEEIGAKDDIRWVLGDAEKLPFAENQFDAFTIAFGIRNCTHIDRVLREAHRVLKRGGRFMCLEFSQVWVPGLSSIYDLYSFQVIPVMGQIFASDWKSYQYLVESIRQFPNQEEFATMIRQAGFRCVRYENMSAGIVAIHSGFKL